MFYVLIRVPAQVLMKIIGRREILHICIMLFYCSLAHFIGSICSVSFPNPTHK